MLINLCGATPDDFANEAHEAVERKKPISHLHNFGDQNHKWTAEDIGAWVTGDIDS